MNRFVDLLHHMLLYTLKIQQACASIHFFSRRWSATKLCQVTAGALKNELTKKSPKALR